MKFNFRVCFIGYWQYRSVIGRFLLSIDFSKFYKKLLILQENNKRAFI